MWRPRLPRIASLAAHGTEALLYDPSQPGTLADALTALLDAPLRARLGAAARARAEREYSWAAHCRALDAALRRVRRVNVLLVTDAFPPVCGGSGWSTYELARGLRARGHAVLVVQPRPGTAETIREVSYDGFRVIEFGALAPGDSVRAQLLQERAAARAIELDFLRTLIQRERIDDHPRPARDDGAAVDRGRTSGGHPDDLHRPRLLAGLLLVRSDSHAGRGLALPGLFRTDDDAVHPATRRRRVAAGAADDSLHAREPAAKANGARARGRGDRRQHDHRGGPAGACA